jgi:hypothetical protein
VLRQFANSNFPRPTTLDAPDTARDLSSDQAVEIRDAGRFAAGVDIGKSRTDQEMRISTRTARSFDTEAKEPQDGSTPSHDDK